MQKKNLIRISIITALILMMPLVAMQFTGEVNWTLSDFIFAGALLLGSGLLYEFVASKGKNIVYRAAVGLAVLTSLLLIWVNGAVGIIGDNDSANMMYSGVILIGLIGLTIARFKPRKMAYVLIAMAIAQMLVPTIALLVWKPNFSPGVIHVFVLNAFFAMLFIGSAMLFRRSAYNQK